MKTFYYIILIIMMATACKEEPSKSSNNASAASTPASVISATESRTQFAEINGKKIAYRSIGSGTPMILCQRFRGNLDSWDPLFLEELAKNYTVIIFDYTGFGSSTGKPASTMLEFAGDVKDLSQSLNYKKIIVGGWSFGGAVAQIVTSEYPDLVSQAILIGTRPPGAFKHLPEKIFLEISAKPENDLNDEIILFFEPTSEISKKLAKESHDRIAKRTIDKDAYIKQELWKQYSLGFEDFAKDPYKAADKLATGKTPILVITADHEVVFPPENWFELNRKMPNTQVIVIPQTGHGPQQQYPVMVAGMIRVFLENSL